MRPATTSGHASADAVARADGRARQPIATASAIGGAAGGVLAAGAVAASIANVVAGDIVAFVHHPAGSVSLGRRVGDAVNTLLLENGWAFTGPSESPLSLTAGPASGAAGDGWASWRPGGDGARELLGGDGVWRVLGGIDVDTTPRGVDELAGTYRRLDVAATGWSTITRRSSLVLAADGTFSRARSTTVMGGGIATPHAPSTLSTWSLEAPELVALDGELGHGDSSGVALVDAARDGHLFGTYRSLEDGVTVELRYADGRVERRLLFAVGDDGHVLGTRSVRLDATSLRHPLYGADTLGSVGGGWLAVLGGAADPEGKRKAREEDKPHVRQAIERAATLQAHEPGTPAHVDSHGARSPP